MIRETLSLDDKYTAQTGQVYMTGIQALVRLPMMQRQRDQAAGLNTAGFISGYRGSPLGNVDQAMEKAEPHLKPHHIHFKAGLNEDLAATAVWGTQQVNLFQGAQYDGVFALWYGKGPGVDRSGDVLKHGNAAGSSRYGGVLVIAGDDHAAKSSTFPHQSDHILAASMIPVLNPAGVQEFLDFGLHGWAMSRYCGCWVAMKAISDTVESSAVVDVSPERITTRIPEDFPIPEGGLNIRWPDPPLAQEERLLHHRLYAAMAYARTNQLNRVVLDSPNPRLGIITSGKSYLDVMQALDDLGIDERLAADIGLRIFKVGMVWPLESEGVRHFAEGLEEILVVEEKRQIIEYQLKEQLYNWREDVRPRVVGKFAEKGEWALPHGDWLLPAAGELTPAMIARAIAKRLETIFDSPIIHERLKFYQEKEAQLQQKREAIARVPHYCSGCPHNTSTKVPDGSRAVAGIGCHYMATWIEPHTQTFTQMGGEGCTWIGQAPFTSEQHVFANLGDGTYFHSGLMAIRAAIAAKVNITYKILYNDAVAMTGGQHVDGYLDVPMLTRQLAAEGVKRIVITTDEPEKYQGVQGLAAGVEVFHRRELEQLQQQLRAIAGTTILIHDQTCAAEKRRRRKRGNYPDPAKRAFINHRVCEGCGDCGKTSQCLSVLPLETPLGRKRTIDQSSCNKDFSCVDGYCPSFVTVEGGQLKKNGQKSRPSLNDMPPLPLPLLPSTQQPYGIMVTGVGGTGVVTIGQILGVAAHLDGLGISVLDMAGLAQKGGAVWSHIRLADQQDKLHAVRIAAGDANVVLGCDLVVTASAESLAKMRRGFTRGLVNRFEAPTSEFTKNPDAHFPSQAMRQTLVDTLGQEYYADLDATRLAIALMGDSLATNMFMLGVAWQKGLIPISEQAMLRAIELNGAAVEFNRQSFTWGRYAAHDLAKVESLAFPPAVVKTLSFPQSLAKMREAHETFLTAYQNQALANRYHHWVEHVQAAEERVKPGSRHLTRAAARSYFKLLSYKDEYEVARLYTDGEFVAELQQQFEGDFHLSFYFGTGYLQKWLGSGSDKPRKFRFGSWAFSALKLLAKLRGLRGTALDVFGWQAERRVERGLIRDFEATMAKVLSELNSDNLALAIEIAGLPEQIRGFGHVKEAALHKVRQQEQTLFAQWHQQTTEHRAA
ncbi:MAG: indolepyruvate ferredoxin oxidoreductase family protein [Aquaspirillum sp.]